MEQGAKALNLKHMQSLGINVPAFVVVSESPSRHIQDKIKHLRYPLIIRSSSSLEDREDSSFAGEFHSVRVASEHQFDEVFEKVKLRNEKSLKRIAAQSNLTASQLKLHYIVQEFQTAKRGGVMKIPQADNTDIIAEVADTPDSVTDGSHIPEMVTISANSDRESWQAELWKAANSIRINFKGDQEAEWLQAKDGELYIVQTRPIVSSELNYDAILERERTRLSRYTLHPGSYETEYLPDIDGPTPLTLELIGAIYASGLNRQKVVKAGAQPLLVIAGNIYLDKKSYRRPVPIIKQLSDSMQLLKAYKSFRSHPSLDTVHIHTELSRTQDYVYKWLTPRIFDNTRQLQIVQSILLDKLDSTNANIAFNEILDRPFQKAIKSMDEAVIREIYWYLADNEYELSAPRYSEMHIDFSELQKLCASDSDKNAIVAARTELIGNLISVFDATYCSNLFQLYDFLCYQRAVLHDRLIESIAFMRQKLLIIDKEHKLHNLIWYATFNEIRFNGLPPIADLQDRKDAWLALQSLPLPHPNKLVSWNDLPVRNSEQSSADIKGVSLSPGVVEGIVGKDIIVTKALTQGVMRKPGIKAIITERGGSLSHVAILAKERHVAIIRIDNATLRFKDNMTLIVDSNEGRVQEVI